MAGIHASANSGQIALTAATAKTLLQIVAPTNQRVRLKSFLATLDGATSTAVPARFRILRQTTAGTFTNTTVAPAHDLKGLTETIQTNCQTVATAEPTAGDVLLDVTIPVYNGVLGKVYDHADEPLYIQGGGRLGFEFTAPATVNASISVKIEE